MLYVSNMRWYASVINACAALHDRERHRKPVTIEAGEHKRYQRPIRVAGTLAGVRNGNYVGGIIL